MILASHRRLSALVLALATAVMLSACTTGGGASAAPSVAGGAGACPTSQPAPLPAGQTRTVTIQTDQGAIGIKVEADLSPIAAGNFVALATCGFYNGSVFHRTVPGFVIQGGSKPGSGGRGGPGYTIKDEPVTAQYGRGTVAMARTSQPNSVDSQFFIVLDDAARSVLAQYNTYQIIGTVSSGMDTVDAIAARPNDGSEANLAIDPIPMSTVTVANP